MTDPHVLFVFVDGLGIGRADAATNPCTAAGLTLFDTFSDVARRAPLPFGGHVIPLAADLGVPGKPQSATGQTTLFTGANAAELLGGHLWAFPNETLRNVIDEHSLFRAVAARGFEATFANAYRPDFFATPYESMLGRVSVTTHAVRAAGLRYRTLDDLARGEAVYHDIRREHARAHGFNVPTVTPAEAGRHLAALVRAHHLTVWEYFLTDVAGHRGEWAGAERTLCDLEGLLLACLADLDLAQVTVLLTSDHGNIEDLSTRGHTSNPVQTLLWGRGAAALAARMRTLLDVYPGLLSLFPPGRAA